jgi:hypothetical protein
MKTKCIISSPSKENLQKAINEFYYSKNYIITEDNRIYNDKLDQYLNSDYFIMVKNDRWQFRIKIL